MSSPRAVEQPTTTPPPGLQAVPPGGGPDRALALPAALVALAVACAAWPAAVDLSDSTVRDLLFGAAYLAAGLASVRAALASAGRLRLAWWLVALSWFLSVGGEALYLVAAALPDRLAREGRTLELIGDLTDGGYYPCLALGLLAFASRPRRPLELARLALDGAVALTALAALGWFFVYRHLEPTVAWHLQVESVLGTGLGEAAVLFAASLALARPRSDAPMPALRLLGLGAFVLAMGDLAVAQAALSRGSGHSRFGLGLLFAGTLLGAAAALLVRSSLPRRIEAVLARVANVPPLAVSAVLLLLGAELATARSWTPVQGLAAGTAALAIMVMARLWLSDRELRAEAAARLDQELRLQHAQRLEVLGQLAGAVAHDFANVLSGMKGIAAELREDRAPDEPVGELDALVRRGTDLCRQLLAYGRRAPIDQRPVDVRGAADGLLPLLRRLMPASVEVTVAGELGRHRVVADPTQLEVALLNLCVNARDAMPRGGALWIRIDEVVSSPGTALERDGVAAGRWVRCSVADTGQGMDEVTLQRAAEPFFTTKPLGHGTGLGLATVQGLATACEGQWRIRSTPGRGTVVTLYLPPAP